MTSKASTSREDIQGNLPSTVVATEEQFQIPQTNKVQNEEQQQQQKSAGHNEAVIDETVQEPSIVKSNDRVDGLDDRRTAISESIEPSLKEEQSTAERADSQDREEQATLIHGGMQGEDEKKGQTPKSLGDHHSSGSVESQEILFDTSPNESKVPANNSTADEVLENSTTIDREDQSKTSLTAAPATIDRELPAPPTPSKEADKGFSSDKTEMAEVAKAFGAGAKILEDPKEGEESPKTPRSGGLKIGKGPPPTTQASEEKPFDFNRFLDQMRHKSAGPVGEYVRSFIKGFTKKPYRVSDQTKLIFDFLDFISLRMRECEVWSKLNVIEFENATEAMEKLLMNRLYNFTFSPAVRREGKWSVQTDDLERDRVLKQRIRLFGWISEEHLDVPTGSHSKGFIDFAIEELLKINHYKAPRDKVICILNCCKVIFGLIRHLSSEENADTFIPILIFVVLRSNPDHMISNVEYISRFRNPEKLSSESGYYLSSLMGAVAFIETMDYTSLSNISQEQFEINVENAVEKMSAQPESVHSSPARINQSDYDGEKSEMTSGGPSSTFMTVQGSSSSGEESARSLPMSAGAVTLAEDTKAFFQRTGEAARAGLGASFGKPIGVLGRLFQESLVEGPRTPGGTSPLPDSGRATPETPPIMTGSSASSSARSRMWGLFGVDGENMQSRQQQQQQQSTIVPRSVSSNSSLNFGNWSRSMKEEEEEPHTPVSEELRQGRFANLLDRSQQQQTPQETNNFQSRIAGNAAPRVQRQQRSIPQRTESIDPYSINDDEGNLASGVRTPDGDGSDVETSSPSQATQAGRTRFSDLSGFLPSFLSEQNNIPIPTSQQQNPPFNRQRQQHLQPSHAQEEELDNEEAAIATAQIEQAHLAAGVETLKSIFPDVDPSVSRLVLEDCQGDLRKTIDKLLEM